MYIYIYILLYLYLYFTLTNIYVHNVDIAQLKISRVFAGPAAMKVAAQQYRSTAGQAHNHWEKLTKMRPYIIHLP